jgi:hypothetical protein
MDKKRHCKLCGEGFLIKRNPKQQYCGKPDCQRARKNHWRCNRRRYDEDYITNQNSANRRWQANHPDYWKQYRASHPDYMQRNREQQRIRDGTAKTHVQPPANEDASHLAKSDALNEKNFIQSGCYWLIPQVDNPLAKSDALRVEISVITTGYAVSNESCKETTL